jgi:hypothetical protein
MRPLDFEDGDAMKLHDQEQSEHWRRPVELRRDEGAITDLAARRAAEAGHVNSVDHGAVLHLQRLAGNAGVGVLVDNEDERRSPVLDVVGKGGGQPLPPEVRRDMETGLGADFGAVRVHDDGAAAASAQAVNAKAYTVGSDVVFNTGAYQPDTPEGRHTIAHELTHVVQQRSGPVAGTPTGDGIALSHPDDRFEREAEATATSLGQPAPAPASAPVTPAAAVQRQDAESEEDIGAQTTPLQRQASEEEEEKEEEPPAQTTPLQRQEAVPEEEEQQEEPAP